MSRLLKYCLLGLICVTLLLAGCASPAAAPPKDAPPEDPPVENVPLAPDFSYRDAEGNEVTLAALRGQVVLLNFWATWCPPCVEELPSMMQLQRSLDFAFMAAQDGSRGAIGTPDPHGVVPA